MRYNRRIDGGFRKAMLSLRLFFIRIRDGERPASLFLFCSFSIGVQTGISVDRRVHMDSFGDVLNYLRELNSVSVILRLALATICGGFIGFERARKRRAAGFRTYMIVCIGAALAMLLNQHLDYLLHEVWHLTQTTDASRLGAQVINGIGFLGAGTILVTGYQQVKGLTTAAGLWASACMGLAIGAGFYEAALFACLSIWIIIVFFGRIESFIVNHSRNMNLWVEFETLEDVGKVIEQIKAGQNKVFDVELHKGKESVGQYPAAIFSILVAKNVSHATVLTDIAKVSSVRSIEEL